MTEAGIPFADRFTGCLLGMAIGDAAGVSFAYRTPDSAQVGESSGPYRPRVADDGAEEIPAGQFSINTELALCLVETIVTSDGFVDPEFATYRFENAFQKFSYLEDARERNAVEHASEHDDFQSGGNCPTSGYAGPAARAIPIAMVHALSDLNVALITREVMRSALITDGSPEVVNGGLAVAHAVRLILRAEVPPEMLILEVLSLIDEDAVARQLRSAELSPEPLDVASVVATALRAFVLESGNLESCLDLLRKLGGATHLTGAIAGALCGAHVGASSIPQDMIDGLEGRAYILMAAPALLRTAQLRAGLVFQLHIR